MSIPQFRSAWRIALLVVLGLLLLIPLTWVRSLVSERTDRAREVHNEIASKWGGEQTIQPPVLSVPYTHQYTNAKGKIEFEETWVRMYPESLAVDAELETQIRKRSLFEVPVYTAAMDLKGAWNLEDASASPGDGWVRDLSRAVISVDPGEARSLAHTPVLEVGGDPLTFSTMAVAGGLSNYMQALAGKSAKPGQKLSFRLQLVQRGSDAISFAPAAGSTHVRLRSGWPSPSFQGTFLPDHSNISASGFDADWSISSLNMDVPMVWRDSQVPGYCQTPNPAYTSSENPCRGLTTLSVSLAEPVNGYVSIDRSMKYGILVVGLAFLALFVFESFLDRALHPIQYGLIGLALAMFYLLTLSISEHLGFDIAYAISSSVVTGLVTGYASSVLAGWKRGAILGVGLVALWSFLYTLLKAEDWALLMGSTGIFLILALVMWLTRRIDWNRRDAQEADHE